MGFKLFAAASTVAIGYIAIGTAAPVLATDQITQNAIGTYELRYGKSSNVTIWTATQCEGDSKQCIRVAEFSPKDTGRKRPKFEADAHWVVGSWIMWVADAKRSCKDGTSYRVTYNYSWDAAINTGWRSYREPGICGDKARNVSVPFTLVKVEPPPGS